MLEALAQLGVPGTAVVVIAFTAWQEHRRRGDTREGATLVLQETIVEGLRADLVRATNESRAARDEAAAARHEAETARAARWAAEDGKRVAEGQLYAYRVDARLWVAQLIAQLNAAKVVPADPPRGFEL